MFAEYKWLTTEVWPWGPAMLKDNYYLPNRGVAVAMGACHACDFSDIWMGDITKLHLDTCPVQTLQFQLYRDDGFDVLVNGEQDLQVFQDHLNQLHPNLNGLSSVEARGVIWTYG